MILLVQEHEIRVVSLGTDNELNAVFSPEAIPHIISRIGTPRQLETGMHYVPIRQYVLSRLSKNGFRGMGISLQVCHPLDDVASYRPHLCDQWN